MRSLLRSCIVRACAVVVGVLEVCGGVASSAASAGEAWWHVNAISAPSASSGGEGRVVVEVSDLGDAMVNATEHSVTIVDTLPAGVSASKVYGEGGGGSLGAGIGRVIGGGDDSPLPCSVSGQVVTCTYNEVLLAYERFMVAIGVRVEPGAGTGLNTVSVSGGGAPGIVSRRALALESVPAFLHHAFDAWLAREFPAVPFERYADDVVAHCKSERQAQFVLDRIKRRVRSLRLELNLDKTQIVYCKNSHRFGSHEHERFDFLGYTFRPRPSRDRKGAMFVNFSPAVSDEAAKKIRRTIKRWRIHLWSGTHRDRRSRESQNG